MGIYKVHVVHEYTVLVEDDYKEDAADAAEEMYNQFCERCYFRSSATQLSAIEEAKYYIDQYCNREFRTTGADYADMGKVGLAYTVTEDGDEIQVNVSLTDFYIEQYVNNKLNMRCQYNSLDELIENELRWLDFDCLAGAIWEISDAEVEDWWERLGNTPINPETEEIEEPFLDFPAGTHREDVWRWFDERHSKGVAWLMYERNKMRL